MIRITFRSTLPADLERLANRVGPAAEGGLEDAAKAGLGEKKKNVRRTYRRAIPRTATGQLRWVRTGSFLAGQVQERLSRFERVIRTNNEAERYEQHVAELRTGPDGINRSNPAAPDTHDTLQQPDNVARDAFVQGFADRLGR